MPARPPVCAVGVVRADGTPIFGTTSEVDGARGVKVAADTYAFSVTFRDLPLQPGHYLLRAHAMDPEGIEFNPLEGTLFVLSNRGNRVILATDGDLNVGVTSATDLVAQDLWRREVGD